VRLRNIQLRARSSSLTPKYLERALSDILMTNNPILAILRTIMSILPSR
jgi:hypothetical protein